VCKCASLSDGLPAFGDRPVAEITARELLESRTTIDHPTTPPSGPGVTNAIRPKWIFVPKKSRKRSDQKQLVTGLAALKTESLDPV